MEKAVRFNSFVKMVNSAAKRIGTTQALPIALTAVLYFFISLCPADHLAPGNLHAQEKILKLEKKEKKQRLSDLGEKGLENLKTVGRGYGTQICTEKKVTKKEDIKKLAWSKIKGTCGKFTFGMMRNFEDDPNVLFSICVFMALESCQKKVGIEKPCETNATCQALLGIP